MLRRLKVIRQGRVATLLMVLLVAVAGGRCSSDSENAADEYSAAVTAFADTESLDQAYRLKWKVPEANDILGTLHFVRDYDVTLLELDLDDAEFYASVRYMARGRTEVCIGPSRDRPCREYAMDGIGGSPFRHLRAPDAKVKRLDDRTIGSELSLCYRVVPKDSSKSDYGFDQCFSLDGSLMTFATGVGVLPFTAELSSELEELFPDVAFPLPLDTGGIIEAISD